MKILLLVTIICLIKVQLRDAEANDTDALLVGDGGESLLKKKEDQQSVASQKTKSSAADQRTKAESKNVAALDNHAQPLHLQQNGVDQSRQQGAVQQHDKIVWPKQNANVRLEGDAVRQDDQRNVIPAQGKSIETNLEMTKMAASAEQAKNSQGAKLLWAARNRFGTAARIAIKVFGGKNYQRQMQKTHPIESVYAPQPYHGAAKDKMQLDNSDFPGNQQNQKVGRTTEREQQQQKLEQQNNRALSGTSQQHEDNSYGEQQKQEQDNREDYQQTFQQQKLEQNSQVHGEQQQMKLEKNSETIQNDQQRREQQQKLEQDTKTRNDEQQQKLGQEDNSDVQGTQQYQKENANSKLGTHYEQQQQQSVLGDQQQQQQQQEVRQAEPSLARERARLEELRIKERTRVAKLEAERQRRLAEIQARERQTKLEAEIRARNAENRARQARLEAEARANQAILEAKVRQAERRARAGHGGGLADATGEKSSKSDQQSLINSPQLREKVAQPSQPAPDNE